MQLASLLTFLRASAAGAQLAVVRLMTGFLRVKYIALTFGPAGTGLLAQATQLSTLGISLGSLSMAVGIINRLASPEVANDENRRRELLGTALLAQLALSLGFLAFALFSTERVTFLIFGGGQPANRILPVLLSVPFSVLASSYLEGILFGFSRYTWYVRASILANIAGILAFLPLAYFFGLDGAFWALLVSSALLFLAFLAFVSRLLKFREIFPWRFSSREFRCLLRFSGVMTMTGIATYGSSILMRRMVMGTLGPAAAGIVQVPIALTAYYTPFLTNALWGRLHPLVAKQGDGPAAKDELATILGTTMVLCTGCILVLCCLPELFISIAYTREFRESVRLVPLQLMGDYFYFIAFTFSVYFLGASRLRVYLVGWVLFFATQVVLVKLLLPYRGLQAIPLAYLGSSLVAAAACLTWFVRWQISGKTLALLGGCLVLVGAQVSIALGSQNLAPRFAVPFIFGLCLIAAYRAFGQNLIKLAVRSHA